MYSFHFLSNHSKVKDEGKERFQGFVRMYEFCYMVCMHVVNDTQTEVQQV